MPARTYSKQNSKSSENKDPKSVTKKNIKKRVLSSDSEDDYKANDTKDKQDDSDLNAKLAKLAQEYEFEPLEPWDDAKDDSDGKHALKRVKKSGGRSADKKSGSKSNSTSTAKQSTVTKTPKNESKGSAKGSNKGKGSGSTNIEAKFNDEEKEVESGVFHNDEHPQYSEADAVIPSFLQEPHVRDAKGRYSNEEDYDPTTLYVPPEELKRCRPLMRQYWDIKSKHFDKLVALKSWKFYYFYFNDAIVVHRVVDMKLTMSGNNTFTFFHESVMARFAPKLIEAGYKIVIIEQMEEHKKDEEGVIRREICQILTRGTAIENQELDYSSRFMLAIFEENLNFGVVFVDTTTHEFYIGEFKDDDHRSSLRTLVTRIKPVEVVYLRSYLEDETANMLKGLSSRPAMSTLSFNESRHFMDIFDNLKPYFVDKETQKVEYPGLLETVKQSVESLLTDGKTLEGTRLLDFERKVPFFFMVQALAICTEFLENVLLAETVISMGTFLPYDMNIEKKGTLYLDSQALQNLEVLEVQYLNTLSEGHSLLGHMDMTMSPFGRRMFRRWLTSPLLDAEKIRERQEAVEDLMKNADVVQQYQEKLRKFLDIERMINRIYNLSNKQRMSAVYFEDFAKARLRDFLVFLDELKKVEEFIETFKAFRSEFKSKRLLQLTGFKEVDIEAFKMKKKHSLSKKSSTTKYDSPVERQKDGEIKEEKSDEGIFPRVKDIISDLQAMVEVKENLPIPAPGVSKENDEIMSKMEVVKRNLQDYLDQQRKRLKCNEIKYAHTKHRYELEVPEWAVEGNRRPNEFAITSKKKGYLRFHTPEIENSLRKLWHLEHDFQKVLIPFICDYFRKFYERNNYWQQVINCLAELDCLCSLARYANSLKVKCRPQVLPMADKPVFDLKGMVHPMAAKENPNFVPNDVIVENDVNVFLITGPNMGGKSTLLRQTCLAVIMAQIGSFVPAESFTLSAVDRIFTRIGASDRILEGKSTFFIEMEETLNIVKEATRHSLLIVDELGRGTSTYDGVSIAYGTLKYIAEKIGCITLFATHYHLLLEEFQLYKNVDTYYMESKFDEENDEIKFLYKFGKGQVSKSHGVVIAKVAGLPVHVIKEAKEKAAFMTTEKRNIGFERNLMEKFNKIIGEVMNVVNGAEQDPDKVLHELAQLH